MGAPREGVAERSQLACVRRSCEASFDVSLTTPAMPRDLPSFIYVGIKNSVIALDAATGAEIWRAKLKGSDFVTVLFDGQSLVAANAGEIFALDPQNGAVLWHNNMKGLGLGIVSLASSRAQSDATGGLPGATALRRRVQAMGGES